MALTHAEETINIPNYYRTRKKHKNIDFKLIKYTSNTYNKNWSKELFKAIDSYDINHNRKKFIKANLRKYFFRFLRNPNTKIKEFTDWLLHFNGNLRKGKFKNMCQVVDSKSSKGGKKGGNTNNYVLTGTGNNLSFCIDGSRKVMRNESFKYYEGHVQHQKYFFEFEIEIKIV